MGLSNMGGANIATSERYEPYFQEEADRFAVFPIKHHDIWAMYTKQEECFWRAEEIDFSKDPKDWETLDDKHKLFIKHILAFFAGADKIVAMNITENFVKDVGIMEAQMFYNLQTAMEGIHGKTYSLMIDTLIKDPVERNEAFNAIEHYPCVKKKMEWALKWIPSNDTFAKRLIAFAIVEGIFFSGAFCAIYWLKQKNLLPGLARSNELISRDEGLHCDFACLLYSKIKNTRLTQEEITDMFLDAVDIEKEFIIDSLPCKLIGMNSGLMSQYIEYVADRLLVSLGYDKIYNVSNPFAFMEHISVDNKTNFFESRPTEYKKAGYVGACPVAFTDDF